MKTPKRFCMLLLALPGLSHGATTYYAEYFPHPTGTGGDISHSAVGWQFHDGATATNRSTATSGYVIGQNNGAPSPSGTTIKGYGATSTDSRIFMAWTDEFADLDRSLTEISSISFASGNSLASTTMRVAIRLGTDWYASTQTFNQDSGNLANITTPDYHSLTFSTAAANWTLMTLTLTGTTELSRSTIPLGSALPSGDLTAAGILFETTSNDAVPRYDNFIIQTIPEPSALVIVSLGALVGLRRRR